MIQAFMTLVIIGTDETATFQCALDFPKAEVAATTTVVVASAVVSIVAVLTKRWRAAAIAMTVELLAIILWLAFEGPGKFDCALGI